MRQRATTDAGAYQARRCTHCRTNKTVADFSSATIWLCHPCEAADKRRRYAERSPQATRRTGHSVDFYTLWSWLDTQIGRPTVYLKDVAVLTCTKYQTTWARRHKNRIPVESARKIATHFGVTPTDIWADWPKGYEQ